MLEQVVVAGGGVVVLADTAQLTRTECTGARDSLLDRQPKSSSGGQRPDALVGYTPGLPDLTWQIITAMRGPGHTFARRPERSLPQSLHVEGTQEDIRALIDFEPTILADIEEFTEAYGVSACPASAGWLRLTYSVDPHGRPGALRITPRRGPSAEGQRKQTRIPGPPAPGPVTSQVPLARSPRPPAPATALPPSPTRRLGWPGRSRQPAAPRTSPSR